MLGLKPIKLLPARERVASALRKAIISKSIPEGAELTLENTAQELGVSVTPVRAASITEAFRIGQFLGIFSGSLLAQARTVQFAQVYTVLSSLIL